MSLVLVKPTIKELKELLGAIHHQSLERTAFSLYPEGFAPGALTEISGLGKTEFLSEFLKEHPDFKAVWIESEITVNPQAFFQKGVHLKNILFIESKKDMSWCITQCLQSNCFQVVVGYGGVFKEKELRRFQLLCEKAKNHFFILSDKPHNSWVPHLQLEVKKAKNFEVKTARRRKHL